MRVMVVLPWPTPWIGAGVSASVFPAFSLVISWITFAFRSCTHPPLTGHRVRSSLQPLE